jgi:hypothetical protein
MTRCSSTYAVATGAAYVLHNTATVQLAQRSNTLYVYRKVKVSSVGVTQCASAVDSAVLH